MTDREKLIELAERCEKASGAHGHGRGPLNKAIADALDVGESFIGGSRKWDFTGSLDAAVAVMPKWLVFSLNTFGNPPKASAYVMNERGDQWRCEGYPATPALALCAASLRARAHTSKETNNDAD